MKTGKELLDDLVKENIITQNYRDMILIAFNNEKRECGQPFEINIDTKELVGSLSKEIDKIRAALDEDFLISKKNMYGE